MSNRIRGRVDDRFRPVIDLEVPGRSSRLLTLLDTGFNGQLLAEGRSADLIPHARKPLFEKVEVIGGDYLMTLASARIIWFGRELDVELLIGLKDVQKQPGDPVATIGTLLLNGNTLTIRFLDQELTIERG